MEELARRTPVWVALSEFYLDTELQPTDYAHLRSIFSRSGYTPQQIRTINAEEVATVLLPNLLTVAGEWAGFNEQWLVAAVLAAQARNQREGGWRVRAWLHRYGGKVRFFTDAHFKAVFEA